MLTFALTWISTVAIVTTSVVLIYWLADTIADWFDPYDYD
jgi:hypothetical protein